jgi:hypothetical protein
MRNFITINEIIEGLYRDLALEKEPNWADWVEWSADALLYIRAKAQFVIRVTDGCDAPELALDCYKAQLPPDFYAIVGPVIINGKTLLENNNTKIYANAFAAGTDSAHILGHEVSAEYAPRITSKAESVNATDYFTIIDGCLVTSVKSGTVRLEYWALPLDENGFPLIPDIVWYKDAIKAFITYKLDHIAWRRGELPEGIFRESQRRWNMLAQAAANKANYPTVTEMEGIKRQWLRPYPDVNLFDKGFRTQDSTYKKLIK